MLLNKSNKLVFDEACMELTSILLVPSDIFGNLMGGAEEGILSCNDVPLRQL